MYPAKMPNMPSSPFRRPEIGPDAKARYDATVNRLARRFIYDEEELNPTAIERALNEARRDSSIASLEASRGDLEALYELLQGIAAHERANLYHHGAWQAALVRQKHVSAGKPRPPQTLTREEVEEEFEGFEFKKALHFSEGKALEHYERLLEGHPDAEIELSRNISLERTDVEVLIIDIRARIAERITDPEERRGVLEALDRRFLDVIKHVPEDQSGKRFELEEIYLLRRLIHRADKGHLASVSHGTPREDLRVDRGSVDVIVAAAGDVFEFQFKTFKSGTFRAAREQQTEIEERARRKLKGSATHLVVLKAEDVQDTFETSLRQSKAARLSLADKYAALEPITRDLRPVERERLLTVIGLTEEDLAREAETFARRQEERFALEDELRLKRAEEERREAEAASLTEAKKTEAEAAERERHERIARHEETQRLASLERQRALTEASEKKEMERIAKIESKKAEAEATRLAEAKKAERARRKVETEARDWPPKNLVGLANAPLLKRIELLPADWTNDFSLLLNAKKKFFALYAKPKRGAQPGEQDKPNDAFLAAFPTRDTLEEKG